MDWLLIVQWLLSDSTVVQYGNGRHAVKITKCCWPNCEADRPDRVPALQDNSHGMLQSLDSKGWDQRPNMPSERGDDAVAGHYAAPKQTGQRTGASAGGKDTGMQPTGLIPSTIDYILLLKDPPKKQLYNVQKAANKPKNQYLVT